jgi:tetratricopeptide (TPR) repeat protein
MIRKSILAVMIGFMGLAFGGCAGGGNRWEAAKAKFEEAIKTQPTLAEAHYNLGLVYDVLRNGKEAYRHFVEAVNLAPGNKIIWSSPAFREYGDVMASPKPGDYFSPAHH